jgi:anti-anti-sigma factor
VASEAHTRFIEQGELALRVDYELDTATVSLYGEMDLATAEIVESELRSLEASAEEVILVDLSGLEFIDSAGLGVLLRACTRLHEDQRLGLMRPRDQVFRMLEISGLAEYLPFID